MLSLTKKSEYALIAVCHLARADQPVISAREIAAEHGVPLPLLMNVLKKLCQAGHVRSMRGARGGYKLAVPPERLSLAAMIEAVEGPVRLVACAPSPPGPRRGCRRVSRCSVRLPMHKVHKRLIELLAGVSVADLAYDEDYRDNQRPAGSRKAIAQ